MNWINIKNCKPVSLISIPIIEYMTLIEDIRTFMSLNNRLILFFGHKTADGIRLFIGIADDANSQIWISSSIFREGDSFPSLCNEYPQFQNFEREFYEEFRVTPEGHPWLKEVRFSNNRLSEEIPNYPFLSCMSEEIHEVAVGPIHAGVIEPGHFRFLCDGENVLHLEIQLGYQHRAIEKLFITNKVHEINRNVRLAESIAGDTVIGHSLAYAQGIEALSHTECDPQADLLRAFALELERIAIHIGDLSALANDIAYISSSSYLGNFRTMIINLLLAINGNRFGRGLLRTGGVNYSLNQDLFSLMQKTLKTVEEAVTFIGDQMFAHPSVLSRMEHTGILSTEIAEKIGLVGLPARASGINRDIRSDHPFGFYNNSLFCPVTMESGDVFARSYMRFIEIQQSTHFLQEHFDRLKIEPVKNKIISHLDENQLVVSMTEAWRGEVIHTILTGVNGAVEKVKIKDPSFNNWFGLALAMRNNAISDFPLCNKSFNLSYCGNDL